MTCKKLDCSVATADLENTHKKCLQSFRLKNGILKNEWPYKFIMIQILIRKNLLYGMYLKNDQITPYKKNNSLTYQ